MMKTSEAQATRAEVILTSQSSEVREKGLLPRVIEGEIKGHVDRQVADLELAVRNAVPKRPQQDPAVAICSWLQQLTHRQMRELVLQIGQCHDKLFPQERHDTGLPKSIPLSQLADTLDKLAYGD